MLSLLEQSSPLSRREWLRVGGLSALGLSLTDVPRSADSSPHPRPTPKLAADLASTFGKAKGVIYLWLQGGPPQHETFDGTPES